MDYQRYKCIQVTSEDRVLTLTLNRPERLNAANPELHRELAGIFQDVREDQDCAVVVLTGAGRAFSAGGDLAWIRSMHSDPGALRNQMEESKKIINDLLALDKPLIAKVNGPALGLGATLALFCDIIIASDRAEFGDPHVKMGLAAGDGGPIILPLLIGICKAKELLFTGEVIPAVEAERLGMINRVVPAAELDRAVEELARKLAAGAPIAIRYTKQAINRHVSFWVNLILESSLALEGHSFLTEDLVEAVDAFREKRRPVFKGS
ncbi:MAG: enoyl-CoA hydratase/isomerase family protein [Gammaproteobacteria bacterium]|nr:enoyl-CoA hydratase/isomerase family protein [Gammaproteobacteria bacterium]